MDLSRKKTKKCKKIVFFGFAFNAYDEAINTLLSKNISDTSKILIIDPTPDKKEIKSLFITSNISYLDPLGKEDSILNQEIKAFLLD